MAKSDIECYNTTASGDPDKPIAFINIFFSPEGAKHENYVGRGRN